MKLIIHTHDSMLGLGLSTACERNGHQTWRSSSFDALELAIEDGGIDLAVVDLCAGAEGGALRALVGRHPALRVLALTSDSSAAGVVSGLRSGADEVLVKPFGVDQLEPALRRAAGPLRTALDWVAVAPRSREVLECARRAAVTDATLLIRGELGVGKTHLARLIHDLSPRRAGPKVEVNLSELQPAEALAALRGRVASGGARQAGRLEAADGGTLIIEGIESLRHARDRGNSGEGANRVEALLLDFLDRREVTPLGSASSTAVNVRVIATVARTTTAPADRASSAIEARLGVVTLDLLPLSQRPEDIAALVNHFLERFARASHCEWPQLDGATFDALATRPFPGNVTELRNLVERAVLLFPGERVELAGLSGAAVDSPAEASVGLEALNLREMERAAVLRSLELSCGNRSVAARALGVSTRTLRNKIRSYSLR